VNWETQRPQARCFRPPSGRFRWWRDAGSLLKGQANPDDLPSAGHERAAVDCDALSGRATLLYDGGFGQIDLWPATHHRRPRSSGGPQRIKWTANAKHPARCLLHDVCVDHGRLDVGVAKEGLDRANVVAILKKMRRETVSEPMARHAPRDARGSCGNADRPLDGRLVNMPASATTGNRIAAEVRCGEQILPLEQPRCPRRLPFEREGQLDPPLARSQVLQVQFAAPLDQLAQGLHELLGERSHAILVAFSSAHGELQAVDVDIHLPARHRLRPRAGRRRT